MTKTIERKRAPQPEMIGRKDHAHGRWTVGDSPAARGIPHTDLHNRKMVAPHGADELDRAIRGHEMMHAKVSPTPGEMMAWIGREVATQGSLIAVEEARVNALCTQVGIPVDKYLADGTEKAGGKKLAEVGELTGLVHGAVACAGTIGGKEFIKGVRLVDKGMAKVLASIQKEVMKNLNAVHRGALAQVADGEELSKGFTHVERIAEWVDRLIDDMEDEAKRRREEEDRRKDESRKDESDGDDEDGDDDTEGKKPEGKKPAPKTEPSDPTKKRRAPSRTTIPSWGKLRIKKLPMPDATQGNLGRKRVASDTGKNPRRMHRYLTDRKVFDRTSKGMGGVVLIDASGSMSFGHKDIREIVEAAPGCTVAMYTELCRGSEYPNLWVLAERGRICKESEMPRERAGNVVDLPALKWAVSKRQRSSAPVIWVSDGGVTGEGDNGHDALNRQVLRFVTHQRVICAPNVTKAKEMLAKLRAGGSVTSHVPYGLTARS